MDWTSIIIAIIGALAGGGLMRVLTIRQTRKNGDIEALQKVIESLRTENDRKDQQLLQLHADRALSVKRYEDKCEEAASAKQMICIHLGCSLRDPLLGQGDAWFEKHRDDISLGVDYTPVNVLMKRLGKQRKLQENGTDSKA